MPFRYPLARRPKSGPAAPTLRDRLDALRDRLRPPQAAPVAPPSSCPVERLGRILSRLQAEHRACDEAIVRPGAPTEGSPELEVLRWKFDRLTDEIQTTMDAASREQATSPASAMLHVLLLGQIAADIGDSKLPAAELDRVLAQASRNAHAAIVCLARLSGVRPEDIGAGYLLTRPEQERMADALATRAHSTPHVREHPTNGVGVPAEGPESASVEAQLIDLNRQATAWAALYDRAGNAPGLTGDCASARAIRVLRALTIRGLGLPATSTRELALQARLIAWDLSPWWDDNKEQDGELACRTLLDRLMGLASVARIPRPECTVAEIEATMGAEGAEASR